MPPGKGWLAAAVAAIILLVVTLATWAWPRDGDDKPPLGLFTSLPIYWSEHDSMSEAIDGEQRHWARTVLETDHRLVPLDTLDDPAFARLDALVMAQPRPLAPQENVALDEWVRNGGRLLLFADPLLTEATRFPLGDRRRPQDVVLLSPILGRWGLQLTFDEDQGEGERTVAYGSTVLPERLAGRLRVIAGGAPAQCALTAQQLVADCRIGKGHAVVVADAALLEADRVPGEGQGGLSALMQRAFAR